MSSTHDPRKPLMRAALAWAERGWHVFPCAPGAKPPALRGTDWRQISTTDPAQIERWWTASPSYHLYYAAPDAPVGSSAGRLGPLIDVRAAGGYVIAPGSRIEGRPYTVLNTVNTTALAPLPTWLAALHEQPPPPPETRAHDLAPVQHASAYAQAALRSEAGTVTLSTRHPDAALNRAAYKLGQLAATGLLTETDIRHALTAAAATTGLPDREITRTITRGLTAGQRNPRQLPPRAPGLLLPRPRDPGHLTPRR